MKEKQAKALVGSGGGVRMPRPPPYQLKVCNPRLQIGGGGQVKANRRKEQQTKGSESKEQQWKTIKASTSKEKEAKAIKSNQNQ